MKLFVPFFAVLLFGPACAAPRVAQKDAPQTAISAPACASGPSSVAALVGDHEILLRDVDKNVERELYEVREPALDKLINQEVLAAAAKKSGLSIDDFLTREVEAKKLGVSDAEARAFYDQNKERLPPQLASKPYEELKPMVLAALTRDKQRAATAAVLDGARAKANVKVLYQPPRVEVAATGPSRGPAGAKITIIEFSDFQCPYCARGRSVMDEVLKAYPTQVRLVFRDFPLSFHEHAQKAAEAGRCAGEQGKFWELHDWMFDHQDALAESDLAGAAQSIGLDVTRFKSCVEAGTYEKAVAESVAAGERAGVHGTPAFFVNSTYLNGALPFERFKAVIDRALAQ